MFKTKEKKSNKKKSHTFCSMNCCKYITATNCFSKQFLACKYTVQMLDISHTSPPASSDAPNVVTPPVPYFIFLYCIPSIFKNCFPTKILIMTWKDILQKCPQKCRGRWVMLTAYAKAIVDLIPIVCFVKRLPRRAMSPAVCCTAPTTVQASKQDHSTH